MAPAAITTATATDIDEFTAKQRAAATARAYKSDLSVFFRWAVRRGLVENNRVLGTDSVRRPKALPKPASAESITAAFTVARAAVQLALLLGALAGLRISEISGLDANNVHLDAEPPALVVHDVIYRLDPDRRRRSRRQDHRLQRRGRTRSATSTSERMSHRRRKRPPRAV